MSLSDPAYFLFLAVAFLLFYIVRRGAPRRVLLLVASYLFYFEVSQLYIGVLIYVTLVTFFGAQKIAATRQGRYGTATLAGITVLVLLPMFFFKYFKFALDATVHNGWADLVLPVGISFFSFAALGYLIDIYLEVEEPQASFERVALFLAFFPVITAGPIERGQFMSQLECDAPLSAEKVIHGLRLILIGLLMKVVLAETIGEPVNTVYANPSAHSGIEQLLAVLYYPFYLYCDFAGYSLIAIGSAQLFGLKVRDNFQQPFFSPTIPEFWRRWHISLSFWVRDYIFLPLRLQWRRQGWWGTVAALLLAFIIIGVWHGAKWGYFVFGCMHGIYSVCSIATLPRRDRLAAYFRVPAGLVHLSRVIGTFLLATAALVFFRADTIAQAREIFRAILSLLPITR